MNNKHYLFGDAVNLLKGLISIPSFSREEDGTASYISKFLFDKDVYTSRVGNNVYASNYFFEEGKPVLLLNSHHDTVKPNPQYSLDPFKPLTRDDKLFGLGSNDAGASLVCLISAFLHYYRREQLPFNMVIAATAEEEISGAGGIEYALPYLPKIDFAIVGEPTGMQMAIAERGLMVLDCYAKGKSGHAARQEGINAIEKAIPDIIWFSSHRFHRVSELLGPVKMSVTSIDTENKAHNVVPSVCHWIVDMRINELYTFEEVLEEIRKNVSCEVKPRSERLRSTMINTDHPLVRAGINLGRTYYGSPTTSDKALMPFPALKLGPGDSARSHSADEFIYLDEINQGIELYIKWLDRLIEIMQEKKL